MTGALLAIENLSVAFPSRERTVEAVKHVSLTIGRGETLALVGESGSGKSVTALSMVGLLPDTAQVTGSVKYAGAEMIGANPRELMRVRGNDISFIFQEPMTSLNPLHSIERQIAESLMLHQGVVGPAARGRIIELLNQVGLRDPEERLGAWPHQLSGGQRQRVMIALALACNPSLVIADEPTTALDVVMQAQVLRLLERLREELGLALILISHDLGVLAETCDRIAIMYAGRIVESGPVATVFEDPQHPYTRRLLDSLPVIGGERGVAPPILGQPPDPGDPPGGCAFHPRCPYAKERCSSEEPGLRELSPRHLSACHFAPWSEWPAVPTPVVATDIAVEEGGPG
jgi:microcin C transport system ATP-binding protein